MHAPVTVLYVVTVLCMDCLIHRDCLMYVLQVGNVSSKHEAARVVKNCAAYSVYKTVTIYKAVTGACI